MRTGLPLRDDYGASAPRKPARHRGDNRQSCRLLAIGSVYDGMSREDAARTGGMDRQTLRDWVIRFNKSGPDGLKDRWLCRSRRLNAKQLKEFADIVERGPDPEVDGVVRRRRVDLQRVIEERFGIHYHERTISKLLELWASPTSARGLAIRRRMPMLSRLQKTSRTHAMRT